MNTSCSSQWPPSIPWGKGRSDLSSSCVLLNSTQINSRSFGDKQGFTAAFVCPLSGIQFLCPGGGKATFDNTDVAEHHEGLFWHSTPELARSATLWFAHKILSENGIVGPRIGGDLPREPITGRILSSPEDGSSVSGGQNSPPSSDKPPPTAALSPTNALKPSDYKGPGKGAFMLKLVSLLRKRSAGGASLYVNTVVKVWKEEQGGENLVGKYGMAKGGEKESVLQMFRRLAEEGFVVITNTAKGQALKTTL